MSANAEYSGSVDFSIVGRSCASPFPTRGGRPAPTGKDDEDDDVVIGDNDEDTPPRAPPVCVDVTSQLLGEDHVGGDDDGDDDDGGEDCVLVSGSAATPIDALFGSIVGVIEQFMCDLCLEHRLPLELPPLSEVGDDHERHAIFKAFIAKIDEELDEYIDEALEVFNAEEVPAFLASGAEVAFPTPVTRDYVEGLVSQRRDELGPEVDEFVTSGCLDYPSFLSLWGLYRLK